MPLSEPFLPAGVSRPDFYIAAMGRSGSTLLCNWLARPPDQLVFVEPFFLRPPNPKLLRIQLADYGMPVSDTDWEERDQSAAARFARLMGPRLKGRRWALKEVLCEEHDRVIATFAPARIILTVRNIADVALSFFEKHRLQNNLDRFSDGWVRDYCLRESGGMVELHDRLTELGVPFTVVRYEDVTQDPAVLERVADFVGWDPGRTIDRHLGAFERGFEIERHGRAVSGRPRTRAQRLLDPLQLAEADRIAAHCSTYQARFGYS